MKKRKEEIDKWKQYLEQLKALGGIEFKDEERHDIRFSSAVLCGLYGIELYFSEDGTTIIGGRNENREMPLDEVLNAVKRFNQKYFYNFKIKKWQGSYSQQETTTVKEIIDNKLWELKYAGKRKPL